MEEIYPHLLCLPKQKEFAWEHPGMQKREKELQICPLALPRSCDSEQEATFKMPGPGLHPTALCAWRKHREWGSVVWGQGGM